MFVLILFTFCIDFVQINMYACMYVCMYLTGWCQVYIIAAELGRNGELLPHDPVSAFAVQSDRRRVMYYLKAYSSAV